MRAIGKAKYGLGPSGPDFKQQEPWMWESFSSAERNERITIIQRLKQNCWFLRRTLVWRQWRKWLNMCKNLQSSTGRTGQYHPQTGVLNVCHGEVVKKNRAFQTVHDPLLWPHYNSILSIFSLYCFYPRTNFKSFLRSCRVWNSTLFALETYVYKVRFMKKKRKKRKKKEEKT